MEFELEIIDAISKVKEKYENLKFIIGYRLSHEESFEEGITMTETLELERKLIEKLLKYIPISQKNYFKKTRRGEGSGIERFKLIHDEIKGKVALIEIGGIKTENDLNSAINSILVYCSW